MSKNITGYIVGALIAMLLVSALVGSIMASFHGTNTTGWSTAEISVFAVLGILVLIGLLYGFIKLAGIGGGK